MIVNVYEFCFDDEENWIKIKDKQYVTVDGESKFTNLYSSHEEALRNYLDNSREYINEDYFTVRVSRDVDENNWERIRVNRKIHIDYTLTNVTKEWKADKVDYSWVPVEDYETSDHDTNYIYTDNPETRLYDIYHKTRGKVASGLNNYHEVEHTIIKQSNYDYYHASLEEDERIQHE